MRSSFRRGSHEEEEESAFVSMTDMTVSFLFIVMLLLAFFATQYSEDDMVPRETFEEMKQQRNTARTERDDALSREAKLRVELAEAIAELERLKELLRQAEAERDEAQADLAAANKKIEELELEIKRLERTVAQLQAELDKLKRRDPLETYLAKAAETRRQILEELKEKLKIDFPDLMIEISAESDALRFRGEGLFRTNESTLYPNEKKIVQAIATRLHEILPCYTFGKASSWDAACNKDLAIIEAVQIEGHTDSQGNPIHNLKLSTDRANATFISMVDREPELTGHANYRGQPVLSVAGYGLMRPVASNETPEGRSTNRRIDLRIIMYTPTGLSEVDSIGEKLRASVKEVRQ